MGYSSRYHAASLAAVFVALGIGILIGAALGSDVVTGTADKLEQGLGEDLDNVRAENADLTDQLAFERRLQDLLVPAVTADRLVGKRIALIALGDSDTQTVSADLKAALADTGASLVEVANVGEPPLTEELIAALGPDNTRRIKRPDALESAARSAGRLLVGKGSGLDAALDALVTGFKGSAADGIDAAVVVRAVPPDASKRQLSETAILEAGLIAGMRDAGARVVGVERSDADESSIPALDELGLATVDNVEQLAGRVSLVLVLDGADGNFGVKDTADALLPELIGPGAKR